MVIENPIQFTIVIAEPLVSFEAFCATSVENNGESAITTRPQKKRNPTNDEGELSNRNRGEQIQQKQDKNNEMDAILFAPKYCESNPLKTQAIPPHPMIRNDKRGIFNAISW